jgi:hypothetical protein
MANATEFSISANTGFSFSEDFNLRCRKISLAYAEEDANSRSFSHPDLHGWILEHRQDLLNAVAGLIQYWHQQGCPPGQTKFTSFPEWAKVVGGILMTCGLGDPCVPQLDGTMTTDTTTAEMKKLFQLGFQENPDEWLTRNNLYQLVRAPDSELFGWLDLNERSGQTSFGMRLRAFTGRSLGGIYLQMNNHNARRPKYRFTQEQPPAQENMAAAVLGSPLTPCNQEDKCQGCRPRLPLQALSVFSKDQDVNVIRGRAAEVASVDMDAKLDHQKAVFLAAEESNANLRYDETGCPMLADSLRDTQPPVQPNPLPVLDLRTRLERVMHSLAPLRYPPMEQRISWMASRFPGGIDLITHDFRGRSGSHSGSAIMPFLVNGGPLPHTASPSTINPTSA